MAAKERPEWLPEGWTVEVSTTASGAESSLYTCLESGCKFHLKEEVMSYINNKKAGARESNAISSFEDNNIQLAEPVQDSPNWLPTGWISETKIRKSGAAAGRPYKIFIDPLTSSKFYSKREVFRHLQMDSLCSSTTKKNVVVSSVGNACTPTLQTRSSNRKCTDYVVIQTESSVGGLPQGWLKEVRLRETRGIMKKDSPPNAESKSTIRGMAAKRCLFSPGTPLQQVEISTQKDQADQLEKEKVKEIQSNSKFNPACLAAGAPQQTLETGKEVLLESVRGSAEPTACNSSEALNEIHLEASSEHMQLDLVDKNLMEVLDNNLHNTAGMTSSVEENINPIPLEMESILASEDNKQPEGPSMELKSMEHSHPKRRGRKRKRCSKNSKSVLKDGQLELKTGDKLDLGKHRRGRPLGWRKNNDLKAITMPLRASKRLAALKADRAANAGGIEKLSDSVIKLSDQLQENPAKDFNLNAESALVSNQHKEPSNTELSENLDCKELLGEQATDRNKIELDGVIMGNSESALSSLFGDSWPDPCIEFAFKTLIGDIPVLENAAAVEGYSHQRPGSNAGSTLDCAASTYKVPKSVG